jgi:hypothetical protein
MSQAALLVLAFLEFNPLPVCTPAMPHGEAVRDALGETSCPSQDMGNDSGIVDQKHCVRRFKI